MIWESIIYLVSVTLITYIANKNYLLPNYTGEIHQKFLNSKNVPLIGGFFLLFCLIKIFYFKDLFYIILFTSIFLVGFFSDSNLITSPKLRLFLQFLIISLFVIYFEIHVTPTRIIFLDNILQNNFLSLFFSIFCLMILINGSNFIDGLNGLLLGYFIIIFFIFQIEDFSYALNLSIVEIKFLIFSISIILFFNFLNLLFMGDGGSYLISLLFGYILISLYNASSDISPYYIILILWYPCFEILFSLIRKSLANKSPMKPDNYHLHQLIFFYYKFNFKLKNDNLTNLFSSLTINIFNFFLIFSASQNQNLSVFQIKLIFLAVSVYCICYFLLKKKIGLFVKK